MATYALNQIDEERRWRERAQAQVAHVASLAAEYRRTEQRQSRRLRDEMEQRVGQLVTYLSEVAQEAI